jgi:peptidoglycan/LPS O-acetylase OafA/YrhL
MFAIPFLQVRLLRQGDTGADQAHSLAIALLRGLAAIQVAAAHLRAEMYPGLRSVADPGLVYQALAFFTGFAHQAVLLFFLISGWLVGGSLLDKIGQPQALSGYAIDRLSRLWTVLLPTFVLMLLAGLASGQLHPGTFDFSATNAYSASSLAGNLVGLQTVTLPQFGGNYALWSLANETWYYLMFPLLLVCLHPGALAGRLASALALLAIALLLPFDLVLYFLAWLLGAVFSRVRIDCALPLRLALLALLAVLSVVLRLVGSNDDLVAAAFVQDLVFSLVFLVCLASMRFRLAPSAALRRVRAVAEYFAAFSFTLYVLHLPVIHLMRHAGRELFGTDRLQPGQPLSYAVYAAMLAAILLLSRLSYHAFEAHTPAVRRWLKSIFLAGRPQPA